MAKSKPKQQPVLKNQTRVLKSGQSSDSVIFSKYGNYIYIGIIILAVFIFFKEGIFEGKVFASSDNLAYDSFKTFLDDAKKAGIFPLWVPYIFMGMPNFPVIGYIPRTYDFFYFLWDTIYGFITNSGINGVLPIVLYYVIFGIGFYIYSNYKFKNSLIALYCALSATFATDFIQRIVVGHNTKVLALAFFPLILLALDKIIDIIDEKKSLFSYFSLLNFVFLTIMLHLQLNSNHIQMIFYSYLFIGIYLLYQFFYRIIKKSSVAGIVKGSIFFAAAALISVSMNADVLMTMKDYNKYSIRGEASISAKIDTKVTDDSPLDYQYATNWSFSPGEVITFLLPYYYGFGDVQVQGQKANLYWGQMPFTTNPMYFGVITLMLGIIGIIYNFRKNSAVQALTVISLIFLVLSFGRNFSVLYDLFFNYFPYFNSFRAPVMIHHFMNIAVVILAGFGLKSITEIVKDKSSSEKFMKLCYVFFGIAGLMFLISIIGFENSYTSSVVNSPLAEKLKQQGATAQQISQYIKQQVIPNAYENSKSDLRLHAFFIILVTGLAYMYSLGKVSVKLFLAGTILIAVIDLWNVDFKTLHWDNPGDQKSSFSETDYTNWLLTKAPDTYTYRVAEFSGGRLSTSNNLAYYRLHTFNGYHGAKIRVYQDAIDIAEGENSLLLTLGGVKYIISDKPLQESAFVQVFKGTKYIYENMNFVPKAYFPESIKVESSINILNEIRDQKFNPLELAYLEKELNAKPDKPDSTVSVKLIKGDIHELEYEVNASGNNLVVFSEIYLPFGWKAYVDGIETEIYKTDYFLRSVIVPSGQHKVIFKYEPSVYFTGKSISIGANLFLGFILIAGIFGYVTKRKKTSVVQTETL